MGWFAVLGMALSLSQALAEYKNDKVWDLDPVVISPMRTPIRKSYLTENVSVYTEDDIRERGVGSLEGILREDTGMDVVKTAVLAGPSALFLRGANSGHVRVMLDGVRLYDPISTNSSLDFSHFSLDQIARVEVLKGPQAGLYGSDAIGGVVQLVSRKGNGKPQWDLKSEYGSFHTAEEALDFQASGDRWHLSAGEAYWRSGGISSASGKTGASERDPYERRSYAYRADYDVADSLTVGSIGRYQDGRYELDDSFAPYDDDNFKGLTRQYLATAYADHVLSEVLSHHLQIAYTANQRRNWDDNDPLHAVDYLRDWYYGSTGQFSWQGTATLAEKSVTTFGLDYLKERGQSYSYSLTAFGPSEGIFPKRYADTRGYFVAERFKPFERVVLGANCRLENHSTFGDNEVYKISASYLVPLIETDIQASLGTGFKAPSLYQLYAPANLDPFNYFGGGNPQLKPEKSQSYEIGLAKTFEGRLKISVTYFHNLYKNLIDAVFNPNTFAVEQYQNVGKAESDGLEVPVEFRLSKDLRVEAGFTHLNAVNKDTHEDLLRRAHNRWNTRLFFQATDRLNFYAGLDYVGHRADAGGVMLKSYYLARLGGSYQIHDNAQWYWRIENVFDRNYEEIKNFNTPGTAFYTGVRLVF